MAFFSYFPSIFASAAVFIINKFLLNGYWIERFFTLNLSFSTVVQVFLKSVRLFFYVVRGLFITFRIFSKKIQILEFRLNFWRDIDTVAVFSRHIGWHVGPCLGHGLDTKLVQSIFGNCFDISLVRWPPATVISTRKAKIAIFAVYFTIGGRLYA